MLEKNRRLEFALNNLSVAAEARVVNDLLPALDTLRSDVYNTRDNADTEQAAVWTRNKHEYQERKQIYRDRRIELCRFMNIPVGPGVQDVSSQRTRC